MSDPSVLVASTLAKVGVGASFSQRGTGLQSAAAALVEAKNFELARCGKTFCGGISKVAGAVVPVVDLPTTTGPVVYYNSGGNAGALGPVMVPKRVSVAIGSGTIGAAGFTLFCGITAAPLATPLTANGATNFATQCTRGTGTPSVFVDVAKTIPAGTAWMTLGGIMTTAVTVTGCGYSAEIDGSFVIPVGYAFVVGALGDTGTSAKFIFQALWDEIQADLP